MNRKLSGIIVAILVSAILVSPVMAIGPTNAGQVGNNPNLTLNPNGQPTMDNPSGSRRVWGHDIVFWLDASKANGVINNAIIADISTLSALGKNPDEFNNMWIYLSGEHYGNTFNNPIDNPDVGSHGMFYWMLRGLGFPHSYALAVALDRAPDGFYFRMHDSGSIED
jgi:hypothetical protein